MAQWPRTGMLHAMAKHQKQRATTFSVTVPTEMAQQIFQLVRDGIYGSAGEVVREALVRLLAAHGGGEPPAADGGEVLSAQKRRGRAP